MPSGPGVKPRQHLRRDADRVERADLDHLIVELHPPRPGDDHVDLLGLVVAVAEASRAVPAPRGGR